MKKIIVGSIESGDIFIEVVKNKDKKNNIHLESQFFKQYGNEILSIVKQKFDEAKLIGFDININDQGALQPVIEARCKTIIKRIQGK
ncbi:MAG: citrate lyase subunit gamma [Mycoplasma sp.]|nr:citrate lyase subunit gamma [Mycoplasma sp.]